MTLVAAVLLIASSKTSVAQSKADTYALALHPAALLDFRPGDDQARVESRTTLASALGQHGRIELLRDPEVTAILGHSHYSPERVLGQDKLALARTSFGKLDCEGTRKHTQDAILHFAAARASNVPILGELRKAYLFQFLCADREANLDFAMAAAKSLRALSEGKRPKEISERSWRKYPVIDILSNRRTVALTIESDVPGAEIWVDHKQFGVTPSTLFLAEGEHLIAIGKDTRSASTFTNLLSRSTLSLTLSKSTGQWQGLAESLDEIRNAKDEEITQSMRSLMSALEVDVVFVMEEDATISVWTLTPSRPKAKLAGSAPDAREAGRLALRSIRETNTRPGLDLRMPLLRESDVPESERAEEPRRWWLYGLVLGAVAAGAGVILLQDLGDDKQRIELMLP